MILARDVFTIILGWIAITCGATTQDPTISSISSSLTKYSMPYGSHAGGQKVYIKGTNFINDPELIKILIGNYPCLPIYSNSYYIQCITSMATLIPQSVTNLPLKLTIYGKKYASCSASACQYSYGGSQTPVLQELFPNSLSPGDNLNIFAIHQFTNISNGITPSLSNISYILIGNHSCNLFGINQPGISPNSMTNNVICQSDPRIKSGEYNFSYNVVFGFANQTRYTTYFSFFTFQDYMVRVMYRIGSSSTSKLGAFGGNIIFYGSFPSIQESGLTCSIGQIECSIINATSTRITIQVPPYDPQDPSFDFFNQNGRAYLGSYGFRYSVYQLSNTQTAYSLKNMILGKSNLTMTLIQEKIVTQLSTPRLYNYNYVEHFKGFMYIPTEGDYRFQLICDDACFILQSPFPNDPNQSQSKPQIILSIYSWIPDPLNPYARSSQKTAYQRTYNQSGYYYTEIYTINNNGMGTFKLSMTILNISNYLYDQNISSQLFKNIQKGSPIYKIETFNITPAHIQPQIITVVVNLTDMSSNQLTSFYLYVKIVQGIIISYQKSAIVKIGDSATIFGNSINQIYMVGKYNPEYKLTMRNKFGVKVTNITQAMFLVYQIIIAMTRSPTDQLPLLVSIPTGVLAFKSQAHSAPISGTYSILINGSYLKVGNSIAIPSNTSPNNIAFALNNYYSTSQIGVVQVQSSQFLDQIVLSINYIGIHNPHELTLGTSQLTGGVNSIFNVSIITNRDYSQQQFYYNVIPLQFLRTEQQQPCVSLKFNKLPIICDGCYFNYDLQQTPSALFINLNNIYLQIGISDDNNIGFSLSDVTVTFGVTQCSNLQGTISNFKCQISNLNGSLLVEANPTLPSIHVSQIGFVDVSNIYPIIVPFIIAYISPNQSDINGGLANITAFGFPKNPNKMTIYFCGVKADGFRLYNQSLLQVRVPPSSSIGCGGNSSINFNNISQLFSFAYVQSAATLNISHQILNPFLPDTIIFTGVNFSLYTSIKIFLINAANNIIHLQIDSLNDTSLTCMWKGGLASTYYVQAMLDGELVNFPQLQIEVGIFIQQTYPYYGSLGGGYSLFITGFNFLLKHQTKIKIGQISSCEIIFINSTFIECLVPQLSDQNLANQSLQVVVITRDVTRSVCTGNCTFYYDINLTDFIYPPSNLTFSAGDTACFPINQTEVQQLFIYEQNYTFNMTNDSICFQYPGLPYGYHQIRLKDNQSYLYPHIATFTPLIINNKLSITKGSLAGGFFDITGNGLSKMVNQSLSRIVLTCGSNNTALQSVFETPNIITVFLPSLKAQTCTIRYYVGSSITAFSYTYQTSLTPTIRYSWLYNYTYSITKVSLPTITYDSVVLVLLNQNGIQTNQKFTMNIRTNTSTIFNIDPVGNYLPAGGYKIYAYAKNYGFANIINSNTSIIRPFQSNITSISTSSSFNGGKQYQINGIGFAQNKTANKILVCGFEANILSANRTSIAIQVPPFATKSTMDAYKLKREQIIKGTWFADTPGNIILYPSGQQNAIYSSSNNECYIGLDTGANMSVWVKKIIYTPNISWSSSASQLIGGVFQSSNDFITWNTLFQIDTSFVHMGANYWLNTDLTINSSRYIRFRHNATSMCQLYNLQIIGVRLTEDTFLSDSTCDVSIVIFNSTTTLRNQIVYTTNQTSIINTITPSYGSIDGGTVIYISGSNLGINVSVFIDEVECRLINLTNSKIYCLTAPRLNYHKQNTFYVLSNGNKAIIQCDPFYYVNEWSSYSSWLSQIPPIDGQDVLISEGTNLLIDQNTSIINTVTVSKGRVIFADKDIIFKAKKMILNEAQLIAGTKTNPISKILTIELHHSNQRDSGIICNNCRFHVFGKTYSPTWVELSSDIKIGDTLLQVNSPVNWEVGQIIVIASSDFDFENSEQKVIIGLTNNNQTIQVNSPFSYKHFGHIQDYGDDQLDMRAEVGLLSRNIKITSIGQAKAGSSIELKGRKQKGLQIHASSFEFSNCGSTGHGCITVHAQGQMDGSYFDKLSIYNSFSRMITIQGTDYLRVDNCIGYKIRGHGISLTTGIQTNNAIVNNIVINTYNNYLFPFLDSYSASFFMSHPYNIIENNRAAGGEFYGFLFFFPDNPQKSSMIPDLCASGSKILSIANNKAHSYAQFGFRLYKLAGLKFPCLPPQNQSLLNPYSQNPSVYNEIYNVIAYKNKVGFLGEVLGNIDLNNFTLSDNKVGIQIHLTNVSVEAVVIKDAVIVGQSENFQNISALNNSTGLITARTDGLAIDGIHFYNFGSNMSTIQSCSQCQSTQYYVSGGKTTIFQGVLYVNVSGRYVYWNFPQRQIFVDLDGTLTIDIQQQIGYQNQTNAFITSYHSSLVENQSCSKISHVNWGITVFCIQNTTIRSIIFANFIPSQTADIKVKKLNSPYDNIRNQTNSSSYSVQNFIGTIASYDIQNTWCLPFLTGHYYNVHWGNGNDFTHLSLGLNYLWDSNDSLVLRFNATTLRSGYFSNKYYMQQLVPSISLQKSELISPQNCSNAQFYFDAAEQYIFVCVSGRNKMLREWVDLNTSDCFNFCPYMLKTGMETFLRYWSNASQWPNGEKPKSGDNVTVPFQWNLLLDIDPPELYYVQINGNLIFDRTRNNTFKAHIIWVNTGTIWIGSASMPFGNLATIELLGDQPDAELTLGNIVTGKKLLLVTGGLQFYGVNRKTYWSYLTFTAAVNSTVITVGNAQDWAPGDKLIITSSHAGQDQTEIVTISSININIITITSPLLYEHYGASSPTKINSLGTVDRRSIATVLSRNIRINSGRNTNYGAKIIVSTYLVQPIDRPNMLNVVQPGHANLYNIEVENFGNYDSPAIHIVDLFAYSIPLNSTSLYGVSIYNCQMTCLFVQNSGNITISSSIFALGLQYLVQISKVSYFNFTNNLMILSGTGDIAYRHDYPLSIQNSINVSNNVGICSGSGIGYYLPFSSCESLTEVFTSNSAGLCNIGFQFNGNNLYKCVKASNILAFGNQIAIFSNVYQANTEVVLTNMSLIDNKVSLKAKFPSMSLRNHYYITNFYISAISTPNYLPFYYIQSGDCYYAGVFSLNQQRGSINITLQNLFGYLPNYGAIYMKNVILQNYNNQLIPNCSKISIFQNNFSMVSIYSTNITRINCPDRDLFDASITADKRFASPSIIYDTDGVFSKQVGALAIQDYWTANNVKCWNISSNGFICPNTQMTVLEFQSISPDFLNKTLTPIYFTQLQRNNTFQCAVSTYQSGITGQLQIFNRFSASLQVNQSYQISYAFPPIDSLYQLQQIRGKNCWLQLSIDYPSMNYVSVYVSNKSGVDILVKPFPIISNVSVNLQKYIDTCGANTFYAQEGRIEIIINNRAGCQVRVVQTSYMIVSSVTDSTIQDFKPQNFLLDFAQSLGISVDRLRIVDMKSSSLQLLIYIAADAVSKENSFSGANSTQQKIDFKNLANKLNDMSQNQSFLGAGQLLSLSSSVVVIGIDKADSGQNKDTINTTNTGSFVLFGLFLFIIVCTIIVMIIRNRRTVYSLFHVQQQDKQEQLEVVSMNQIGSTHPLQLESNDNA